jgi:hypothetical protein
MPCHVGLLLGGVYVLLAVPIAAVEAVPAARHGRSKTEGSSD